MSLVDDDQVPFGLREVRFLGAGELVRADDDGILLPEGVEVAGLDLCVERTGFQDERGQEELVGEFLTPLLAEIGRHDDQEPALAFGPPLGKQDARLDGLTETHLVGEDGPFGQGRLKGKEGGLDLVGIQIDLGISQRSRQFADAVRRTAFGQLMGKVGGVIRGVHGVRASRTTARG